MQAENYEIVWLVRRLFRAMGTQANERLRDLDITAADRAVLEFLHPDKKLSVPDIAAKYDVSRQHVQVTVNRLADKGLLNREENPRHKRSPLIALTAAGRKLFDQVIRNDRRVIDELFADIPASNRKVTRRTLARLLDNIKEGDLQ